MGKHQRIERWMAIPFTQSTYLLLLKAQDNNVLGVSDLSANPT
jgi:hypothetical protein